MTSPAARRGYPPPVPSIFSRIVAGEIPAHRLREDDRFLAVLDVRPIRPGHSLVVPKEEIDHFFDCVARKAKPNVDLRDGYRVQRIIDACARSSDTGRWVDVD